ncbi:MAG: hypothetical protein LAT56_14665 [Wenzhouxiangella sp.]|nr:hypothetical protein [Wenzhouxiangella sp.]
MNFTENMGGDMRRAEITVDLGHSIAKGSELEFISQIKRDGSGVEKMNVTDPDATINHTEFRLQRLSITKDTYIAQNFYTYVVKLKEDI